MLALISVLIAAYLISTRYWDYTYISTIVATIVAALGIFGVWIQLKKEADIKEAEFLMSFNFTFITTEKFVEMEKKLEHYRKTGESMNFTEEDRQNLIDYLVYLESFAPLILNKMVRLEIVDNLFGYRYFLAVNNPEVQAFELCIEAEYYRGCFAVYRKWKEYRIKKNLPIPLESTELDRWEGFEKYGSEKGLLKRFLYDA